MGTIVYVVVFQYRRMSEERKRNSAPTSAEINGGTAIWIRWSVRQIMNMNVRIVKSLLLPMEIRIENIAPTSATLPTDLEVAAMTKQQMDNENMYQATMMIAKNLLNKGAISEEEYTQIDTKFKEQYAVSFSTLFTDINLINYGKCGNM